MNYYTYPPTAQLSNYIRCFWVLEGDGPYIHRSMADGCAEMVFHHKGLFDEITSDGKIESSFKAGLSGQSQIFRRFVTHTDFAIFGVYLYPYALPQMVNIPASEFCNQLPDLNTFLGHTGKLLTEQIFAAASTSQRVKIITAFIERQLSKNEQNE